MSTTAAEKFELLRATSLTSLVQAEVLRMIKSGELTAGQRVNELDLAERLRISRSPLREALRALEEAGLVQLERNRGMFVRAVSESDAVELYEVRAALDDQTGRSLARKITDAQLAELTSMLDMLEACGDHHLDRTFPLNISFHDRLVEMAGNDVLLRLYRQIINRMHLLRRLSFAGGNAASHAEHRLILAALAQRDPNAAAASMRDHVERGFERMRNAAHAETAILTPH